MHRTALRTALTAGPGGRRGRRRQPCRGVRRPSATPAGRGRRGHHRHPAGRLPSARRPATPARRSTPVPTACASPTAPAITMTALGRLRAPPATRPRAATPSPRTPPASGATPSGSTPRAGPSRPPSRSARPRRRPPRARCATKVAGPHRTATATSATVDAGPGTGTGPQPGLVILVSFANQASVGTTEDQWAAGLLRRRQLGRRLLPGQQLREVRAGPGRRDRRRAPNNGVVGWLQLPYDHPNFGNDFDARRDQARRRRRQGRRPLRRLRVLRHRQRRRAQRLRAARHGDRGGLRDVVRRRAQRLRQQRVGPPGRPARLAPKLDGTVVNRDGGTMFGEWMCTPSNAPGQMSTHRDHGARDRVTTSASPTSTTPTSPAPGSPVERDVERQLEPGRHRLLRHHARRAGRVLEVLPGLDRADAGRRRHQRRPAAGVGDQPDGLPAGRQPRRRRLEVRGAQGRGRVLPRREPPAGRLGRRPPRLRRDRLPRRRGRHVHQQGQRRREPPAGRRRRGRRQPGHWTPTATSARPPTCSPAPAATSTSPTRRRRRRRCTPGSRRVRRCTSTAAAPTR